MRILLTGSTGFVGRHLKARLERDGHEVRPFYRGEISIPVYIDAIINCAGELDRADQMIGSNVKLVTDLLGLARTAHCLRFIQIGSSSETGPVEGRRSETTPCQPSNLYEATKLAATNLCLGYAQQFDKDICIARPFTLYGSNDKPRKMLPTLWRARQENLPFSCFAGGHDWLHVDDFVEGIVKLLHAPREATKGQIYHFGSEVCTSNSHVVEQFMEVAGKLDVTYHTGRFRPYDVEDWCADSSKAKARLGWEAKISLEEGIHRFVNEQ
jgi:nucleoside-diphosphate-sugar epimerase